jgi:hypothetical protein
MMALSGFLFFLRYGIQLSVVNAGAKCFDESRYYVTLPLFDILLPVLNSWYRLTRLFHKDNAHTWRVLK